VSKTPQAFDLVLLALSNNICGTRGHSCNCGIVVSRTDLVLFNSFANNLKDTFCAMEHTHGSSDFSATDATNANVVANPK